jgi:ABC-2 type transport system permease protein
VRGHNAIWLVARRELVERSRERSFIIGTIVTLVILAAVIVLPELLGDDGPDEARVAVSSPAGEEIVRAAGAAQGATELRVIGVPVADEQAARAALEDEEADAALVGDTPRVVVLEELEDELAIVAFVALFLLYVQLIGSGYMISSGIVEEKASRVVELLLAAIRPRQLLTGKVLGIGLLVLGQLVVIGVFAAVLALAVGALEVPAGTVGALGVVLVAFVFGYAFYATVFAVAGALVPRQEELQSSSAPLIFLLIGAFAISFQVVDDPDGTLGVVLGFVPPCAPLVLPVRIISGEPAWWEIAGGVVVLMVATAALMAVAARVYSNAILRTGSSVKLREALAGGGS